MQQQFLALWNKSVHFRVAVALTLMGLAILLVH